MKIISLVLTLAYALIAVTNAQAQCLFCELPEHASKVNTHIPTDKPDRTCHSPQVNGWIVELQYYPIYEDYLSDLAHYFEQYPGTCKVTPEPAR
jgi:hypothetical protein